MPDFVTLGCRTPNGRLPDIATTTALADPLCDYMSHPSKPLPLTALEACGHPSGGWRPRALAFVYGSSSVCLDFVPLERIAMLLLVEVVKVNIFLSAYLKFPKFFIPET